MTDIVRLSPIQFAIQPQQTEKREGWEVALSYGTQKGPFLIDLSHRPKWDFQDADLSGLQPFGLSVPAKPGQCVYENGMLINRMNRTQCAVWHLAGEYPGSPGEPAGSQTTDGLALLALTGRGTLPVMERVTNLDLADPARTSPCLLQGSVLHIPCQVVLFSRNGTEATVLLCFSRGYGQAMAEALLQAGKDVDLSPGGENNLFGNNVK